MMKKRRMSHNLDQSSMNVESNHEGLVALQCSMKRGSRETEQTGEREEMQSQRENG